MILQNYKEKIQKIIKKYNNKLMKSKEIQYLYNKLFTKFKMKIILITKFKIFITVLKNKIINNKKKLFKILIHLMKSSLVIKINIIKIIIIKFKKNKILNNKRKHFKILIHLIKFKLVIKINMIQIKLIKLQKNKILNNKNRYF